MYCKNCYKLIDDNSDFCPHCGQNQKGKVKKKGSVRKVIGITIAIIGFIGFFGAFLGALSGGSEPEKVGEISQPDVTIAKSSTFTVGDVVELSNVHVTLKSVKESTGAQFFVPDDGNVFLICEFNIENYSSSDVAVSSLLCFEAYIDDYAVNMDLSATASADKNQLDGTVAAGKKMNGVIGYQAPANWSELEIRFTPDFWSGKDIVFEYSKYSNISEPKLDEIQDDAVISNGTMDVFFQGSHDEKDLGVFYIDLKIKNKLSHEVVVNLESADVDSETVPLVTTGTPVEIRPGNTTTASFIFSYSSLSIDSLKDANNATFKVVFRSAGSYDVLEESELVTINLK